MRRSILILAGGLCLSGCVTGISRMSSYPHDSGDAVVHVGSKDFRVWIHRTEPAAMVQQAVGQALGRSFVEGMTLNSANLMPAAPYWRAAAQAIVQRVGCSITDLYTLDNRMTWEARFTCPAGADVVSTVNANRETWRKGVSVADPFSPSGPTP